MYELYLDGVMFPVAPSKITMQINNQNETMNLANCEEINILKSAGLTTVSFDLLIPKVQYPFAKYADGFQSQSYYLSKLSALKTRCKTFQFIVTRSTAYNTNLKVSLESYKIIEDASNGEDLIVTINLKQYVNYGTKKCTITIKEETATIEESVEDRETSNSPEPTVTPIIHIVKWTDTCLNLAKHYYGDETLAYVIHDAKENADVFWFGWLMKWGAELTIPVLE